MKQRLWGSIAGLLNIARRLTGTLLLIIGILGLLLPVLPGWSLIIPGVALLGRRDRLVRLSHLAVRYALRWMRRRRQRHLRTLGWRLTSEYGRTRRIVLPAIVATERAVARALAWG
ncbi:MULTISPECIES: hypothetical protein [Roseiflexus]|jgi:hypothetical protein|uniref:Transmembrane protein (PGPGW) n=1 Tax=Roseiflexus castenholzii (strain DSM 13941 / HLO8) TaxID=383372 RepID=A7NFN0_ROSCS|nr:MULTISPECIES: hypothetical protein [Roseiflexus]ABU56256.1 conserved hypothetical protein [Roseiflexus castenholzii DSM 13941]